MTLKYRNAAREVVGLDDRNSPLLGNIFRFPIFMKNKEFTLRTKK